MTTTDAIDTGFAPWSLMTPDPEVSKRAAGTPLQEARIYKRDGEGVQAAEDNGYMFGDDGFTFGDFLDVINPLQHLPLIGPIYRSLTGDDIDPGARVAGSTLFGGPIGLAAGLLNTIVEDSTGDDVGGNALALLFGDDSTADTLATAPEDDAIAGAALPPVQVASLATAGENGSAPGFAELASLYGTATNSGATTGRQLPAARYGAPAKAGEADMASIMFAANGNSYAAANVAAFNQAAFRRIDLADTADLSPADQPRDRPAATPISQRMAEHLAKLAAQTQSEQIFNAAVPSLPSQASPSAPRTISGPLPRAFTATAPEGNPFAASQPAATPAMAVTVASQYSPARPAPVRADTMAAAIAQAESPVPGLENPDNIARAMLAAIERYEQQRALNSAG